MWWDQSLNFEQKFYMESLTRILNEAFAENKLPEVYILLQSLVLIFKGKDGSLIINLYRDVKLLEHLFNLYERTLNKKLREIVYTGFNFW